MQNHNTLLSPAEAKRVRERNRTKANRERGLCPQCGSNRDNGTVYCLKCHTQRQASIIRIRERGGCVVCGKPAAGMRRCEDCRQRRLAENAALRASGICDCGRGLPFVPGKRQCVFCEGRGKRRNTALRKEVIEAYGGACNCCGEANPPFLQIDHINGRYVNGSRDADAGFKLYARLKREGWPEGFQVLCCNCNFAKGIYGQCPHVEQAAN